MNTERKEALMRILIGIITGIILSVWRIIIFVLIILNFVVTLFTKKRNKEMAMFCEYFNTELYKYAHYMTFVSNKRPFPFSSIKRMSPFQK